ncbi:hypothetical protein LCGC14_0467140 [marine sediment metagenome]|uniref:Uncharacterized protein n=1 Tax=marine sediment metagenome TaxID=412755 RepID=A0A0F9V039_9ZZZZ
MGDPQNNVDMASTSAPWGPQQPYLENMFQQAWDLPEMQAYGGDRVAGFDPAQTGAMDTSLAALRGGGTTLHGARGVVDETLAGKYLDPSTNPYLEGTFKRATEQYVNPVTTAAVSAGRFGSGAQAAQTGEAFARTANEIYGQNYQQERGRQMQAVGMAPQVAFAPEAAQFGIGAARQGMNQQMMNAAQQQFQEQQLAPWQTLMNRRNLTTGDFGGEATNVGTVPESGGK